MCIDLFVFNRKPLYGSYGKRQIRLIAHFTIVEVKNKSQLDNKIGVNSKAKGNLRRNRTSAFRLKL